MKKLICAAVVAGSMFATAEEAAKAEAAPAAPVAAEAVKEAPKRPQMTAEQRAEMRARFEKRRSEMRAEMDKKMVEVIKKYGLDDEKANALWKDLQETMKNGRRNMMRPGRPMKKPADPAAK